MNESWKNIKFGEKTWAERETRRLIKVRNLRFEIAVWEENRSSKLREQENRAKLEIRNW